MSLSTRILLPSWTLRVEQVNSCMEISFLVAYLLPGLVSRNLAHYVSGEEEGDVHLATSAMSGVQSLRAFTLEKSASVLSDEQSSPPIFNYARVFTWSICADQVADAFEACSTRALGKQSVSGRDWVSADDPEILVDQPNRSGNKCQLIQYCSMAAKRSEGVQVFPGVLRRMLIASLMGLFLQWGTTMSAFISAYSAPTTGVGCRSGGFLLYACVSTTTWLLMTLSSILAQYSKRLPLENIDITVENATGIDHSILSTQTSRRPHSQSENKSDAELPAFNYKTNYMSSQQLARTSAKFLNLLGKVLAVMNALWVSCAGMLQLSRFYDSCYCKASVLGRGSDSFATLFWYDVPVSVNRAWIAAVVVSVSSAGIFIGYITYISYLIRRAQTVT